MSARISAVVRIFVFLFFSAICTSDQLDESPSRQGDVADHERDSDDLLAVQDRLLRHAMIVATDCADDQRLVRPCLASIAGRATTKG
jgi:hypothetical protein